jgi:hypothetical protein
LVIDIGVAKGLARAGIHLYKREMADWWNLRLVGVGNNKTLAGRLLFLGFSFDHCSFPFRVAS